jgi:large subunit ribosomal protein L30
MSKIKIKIVKSVNGCTHRQKHTVDALGLKKTNSSVEVEATPQIMGMVEKVKHLVEIENI